MIVSYINENIQAELEKRRKALARESNSPLEKGTGGTKQFNKYLSRTPYVVMASNLDPPELNIAIGGGARFNPTAYTDSKSFFKTDSEGKVTKEYKAVGDQPPLVNHMHGFKNDGTGAYRATKSKGISPIPGIKDISVEYKGGYKGIREATVNWGVSSLEDLEFYTPHFLAIGRSVALEWGWTMFDTIYEGEKFITYTESAIKVNGVIFRNPSKIIIAGDGNLDGIGGVVTNFNFKLREDGGFDCTTILSALGVNFFGGDGLDSSGEIGLGSILMDKNKITAVEKDISLLYESKEISKEDKTKLILPEASIIEELINLPSRILSTLYDSELGDTPLTTTISGNVRTSIIRSKEKNLPFFLYLYKFKGTLDNASDERRDCMIRWGWLEDNVFSKYTAAAVIEAKSEVAVGYSGPQPALELSHTLFNFRSIDEDGNSIKIGYDENLIPVNPFRSMIFADSTAFKETDLDGGDLNIAVDNLKGTDDGYFDRYSGFFVNYFKMPDDSPAVKFNESGYGKLRNIYVSLTDVLESFGFDPEYTKSLVSLISHTGAVVRKKVGGGKPIKIRIGGKDTFYANSDKITPTKTMESAINKLLNKINRNFHNFWKFKIVSDTETMDNIRIVDENYVAPNPNMGPEQSIDYTLFGVDGKIKTDESRGLGIYAFPSFTIGSTVKSQTLEFKIPDAMKTVAMYGTNTPDKETPADPSMRKFKALGGINKNPFIKSGGDEGTHLLSNIKRVAQLPSFLTYGNTYGSGSLKKGGNTLKGQNRYKFVKMIEKTVKAESSAQSLAANPINDKDDDGNIEARRFYIIDTEAISILLKAEAVTFVRTELGVDGELNKSYLIPAELGLEIDGIGGIKPGNICHTDYIQRIYNERTTADKGPNTFFQIFGITQKVSDDGWTTSLDTTMRLNGNALGASLTGSFDDILDIDFGTPVDERKKAESAAVMADVADIPVELVESAAEEGVGVKKIVVVKEEPGIAMIPTSGETRVNLSLTREFTLDRKPRADYVPEDPLEKTKQEPVTTAVTGNVEYEGTKEQNLILYEARPDLRQRDLSKMSPVHRIWVPSWGYHVAPLADRKKAWDALHNRDPYESHAVIAAEAARVEAAKKAIEDAQRIKDTEAAKEKAAKLKAINIAVEAERIAVAIHKAMDGGLTWPDENDQMWNELDEMKSLDEGGMEYTNAVEAKFNSKYGSGTRSRANLKAWFLSDLDAGTPLLKRAYAYFGYEE